MKTESTPTDADITALEAENRRNHFLSVAQSFEDKANDPDFRISETERKHFLGEAARCRSIANCTIKHPSELLKHHVTGAIERGEKEPIVEHKEFKVVAVSENTNAFGLKSIILVARDGEAWRILKSPYGGDAFPAQGDVIRRVGDRFQCGSYECPDRLDEAPAGIIKEVWS